MPTPRAVPTRWCISATGAAEDAIQTRCSTATGISSAMPTSAPAHNPLVHYLQQGRPRDAIQPLFDSDWYLERNALRTAAPTAGALSATGRGRGTRSKPVVRQRLVSRTQCDVRTAAQPAVHYLQRARPRTIQTRCSTATGISNAMPMSDCRTNRWCIICNRARPRARSKTVVDSDWYLEHYADVRAGVPTRWCIICNRAAEGRIQTVVRQRLVSRVLCDVRTSGANAAHYLQQGRRGRIQTRCRQRLVSRTQCRCRTAHQPLVHYLQQGAPRARSNPLFDSDWYLEHYADVRTGAPTRWHYLHQGARKDTIQTVVRQRLVSRALCRCPHRVLTRCAFSAPGGSEGYDPNPLFDSDWYLEHYADVRPRHQPLVHYLQQGAPRDAIQTLVRQRLVSRALCDVRAGVQPAGALSATGGGRGTRSKPLFDSDWYLERYADVRAAHQPAGALSATGRPRTRSKPVVRQRLVSRTQCRCPHCAPTRWCIICNRRGRGARSKPLFDTTVSRALCRRPRRGANPAGALSATGGGRGRDPNPLFDSDCISSVMPMSAQRANRWHIICNRGGRGTRSKTRCSTATVSRTQCDVRTAGTNPLVHYLPTGAAEGRDPNRCSTATGISSAIPKFAPAVPTRCALSATGAAEGPIQTRCSTATVSRALCDVRAGGANPLVHYLQQGARDAIQTRLFDSDWYLEALCRRPRAAPTAVHYLRQGGDDDPNPLFDGDWYLERNADVRRTGTNPVHYLQQGGRGRDPNPLFTATVSRTQCRCPHCRHQSLAHYLQQGGEDAIQTRCSTRLVSRTQCRLRRTAPTRWCIICNRGGRGTHPNPLFDSDWYLEHYADVRTGTNPLCISAPGASEGYDPNPLFRQHWYLEHYADVRTGVPTRCALSATGAPERDPNPLFDSDWYLDRNPKVSRRRCQPAGALSATRGVEGYDPNPLFDSDCISSVYAMSAPAVLTRWHIFCNTGGRGRDPNPLFDSNGILTQSSVRPPCQPAGALSAKGAPRTDPNPSSTATGISTYADVRASGANPLVIFCNTRGGRYDPKPVVRHDWYLERYATSALPH